MLFSGIADFFLNLFIRLINFLNSLLFVPLNVFLNNFVPNYSSYLSDVYYFINNYILKGLAFAREVFFNLTGFPRELYYLLISFLIFKFGFMVVKWAISTALNAYYLVRGTKS